jgi:hypothetical protein
MKSRSTIASRPAWLPPPRPLPRLNGAGKPPLTMDEMVKKWAGVFEPEFWEEVRKARRRE